jgi:hypothetical protein
MTSGKVDNVARARLLDRQRTSNEIEYPIKKKQGIPGVSIGVDGQYRESDGLIAWVGLDIWAGSKVHARFAQHLVNRREGQYALFV